MLEKQEKRLRRHKKVRSKIKGTKEVPRLCVFKSNKYIEFQLVNDDARKTIASCKEKIKDAEKAGKIIAEKALKNDINKIVFDRGGYKYHGRIKAAADSARKAGLKF